MFRGVMSLAFALAVAAFVMGCGDEVGSGSATASQPTPLLEGFNSLQAPADVEDALRRAGKSITVLEEGVENAKRTPARTPLSVRIVRASPFTLWGVQGDLRLEFIDGELASTWFYPREPRSFEAELKKRGLDVKPSRPLRLHAATEFRSDVDHSGAKYWAWEDARLRHKLEQWIKRNA